MSRVVKGAAMVRWRGWALWAGLLCLLWCGAASALSRDGTVRDLRHSGWGPKEGAPDRIQALAQTRDGYLWIGSAAGLFRFDGLRFEHIDLPRDDLLSSANVFCLFAPASGGLWIGLTFGGAVFLKDGRFTAYSERDGLPKGAVIAFAEEPDGTLWAGTRNGIARMEGSKWRKAGPEYQYPNYNEQLMVDSAGTLWAASRTRVAFLPKGGTAFQEAVVQPRTDTPGPREDSVGIAETPAGTVWLYCDQVLSLLRKNDNPARRTASSGFGVVADRDGSLWVARQDAHVQRIAPAEDLTDASSMPTRDPSDSFSESDGRTAGPGFGAVLEDREGNVWISSDVGLDRFSERNVSRVLHAPGTLEAFPAAEAAIAAGDDGSLWIGGRLFPTFNLQAHDVRRFDEIGYITCVLRTEDGSLWFGTKTSVWKYAAGRFERFALPDSSGGGEIQAMAQDRSGALWISLNGAGVYRLEAGKWQSRTIIESQPKMTAIALTIDATGRVWFGYTEGRMAVLDGDELRVFSDDRRAPVGTVTAISGRRGRVWAGGAFGLALFDGSRFRPVTPEAGTNFDNVTGIVETTDGDLWINGGAGIVHIAAAEAKHAADDASYRIHSEIFDALDGVEGSTARARPLPTAIEGTDRRLWFLTNIGLYAIAPGRLFRNTVAPPVSIQSVTVDDRTFSPAAALRLPQRTTSLRIDYAAISLTMAEKVRYRYQLDGVDKGWQDAQGRRQAFYTNLRPGAHRFRVIAANNDGVWNETGAMLDFVIPPTFVQTGWFIALCVGAAAVSLWALIRLRVRQVASRMRLRFEERMAERERIARELHDTLLQGTQGLIYGVQAAARTVPPDGPARTMLEQALARAESVMAEGRDRIQDLRVPEATGRDLAANLVVIGEDLAKGRDVAFRAIVEGTARSLRPTAHDEAYGIGREALLNAFRHAEAASVEIQLIYAEDDFSLHIRDDGVGLDAGAVEAGRRGHWGLQGMRERAKRIGARFEIWSRPDAGTEIALTIPATAAYRERAARSRWRPLRFMVGDER